MLFGEIADYYSKLEATQSRIEMVGILKDMFSRMGGEEIAKMVYMTQGVLGPSFESLQVGIAEKLAEEAIAEAAGYEKKDVVAAFRKTGDLGTAAEELSEKKRNRLLSYSKLSGEHVFDTMMGIAKASGEGSKDAKIKGMVSLLSSASPLEARYIVRFALGTLRLGAGDATIMEALALMETGDRANKDKLERAYNVCGDLGRVARTLTEMGMAGIENFRAEVFSPVKPALAERLPTSEEIMERMGGRCAVESKYDGLRAQVHFSRKKGKVEIFSRNLERITEMFPDISEALFNEISADECIVEGEVIAYDEVAGTFRPFQETIQRKRKHDIDEKSRQIPVKLFLFDVLYLDGKECFGMPYKERRGLLEKMIRGGMVIEAADRIIASSPKELDSYFERSIESGLEGIVAKGIDSVYVAGARRFSWIKLKRSYKGELSDTVDLVIIGYYRGKGSRTEFGLGGLLCAVYNDATDMFESITKIGTGFTEHQMKDLWDRCRDISRKAKPARVLSQLEPDFWVDPKYVIEVRADEITRSPTHMCGRESGSDEGYALRFPRIVSEGIREDKSAEDATTTEEIVSMYSEQKRTKVKD